MVKQFFSNAFEREQITEQPYECMVCSEAVFNPLCPNCIAEQIEAWLSSYPDLSKKIMLDLKKFLIRVNNSREEATECIACRRKRAAVCPYCFTEYALGLLKKLEVNKRVLVEFLQFFNFDFEHTGYTKDAEKLGML